MTEIRPAGTEHVDVASFALGLLEEPDRLAFEKHLADCAGCTAELAEFSGMRALVSGITPAAVSAPDETPIRKLDSARAARRPWRTLDKAAAAAAAIALILTGLLIGSFVAGGAGIEADSHHRPAGELLLYGQRFSANDPGTGATGIVGLGPKGFGTHVAIELRGVSGPLLCRLVAVSTTGAEETVTSWGVPERGYGVPGAPDPLVTHGGTSFAQDDIARFEVRAEGRGTILTIPI